MAEEESSLPYTCKTFQYEVTFGAITQGIEALYPKVKSFSVTQEYNSLILQEVYYIIAVLMRTLSEKYYKTEKRDKYVKNSAYILYTVHD